MSTKKVRFAVVGTGWFAQEAILPAFPNAENAELTIKHTKSGKIGEPCVCNSVFARPVHEGARDSMRASQVAHSRASGSAASTPDGTCSKVISLKSPRSV